MTTLVSQTHFECDVGSDQLASTAPAYPAMAGPSEVGRHSPAADWSRPTATDRRKRPIIEGLREVSERFDWILSTTLTGSFLHGPGLEGISDIDFVVIVDRLNAERFELLNDSFREALAPVLVRENLALRLNPTLGPLKFNDERTAVLHLMLYSHAAHVEHVIQSPFTCFDWQRSPVFFKQSLADVYPVFGLQPHHFISARRSIQDYLRDYRAGVVSYRELACDVSGYREVRREKPMTLRDRHEFAYHILRFLMQNTLKLLSRRNEAAEGEALVNQFASAFGDCGGLLAPLYRDLTAKKKSLDFASPLAHLDERLEIWVSDYEQQFRRTFFTDARRHILFRHAPTAANRTADGMARFLGRSNPDIEAPAVDALAPLARAVSGLSVGRTFSSPLARCQQSLAVLGDHVQLPRPCLDARLEEIDYGHCEGLTCEQARQMFPRLGAGWASGQDVRFPDGECTADVARRLESFIDGQWDHDGPDTLACTHNVVLRSLVGLALNVPPQLWHRLRIPHLAPISVIQTRRHGWFVDLDEATEREIFRDLVGRPS